MEIGSTTALQTASRRRRLAAFFIDHFTFTFLMVAAVFIGIGPDYLNDDNVWRMFTVMPIVMIIGFTLYLAKDCLNGMSLGKWVMGIMVRDADNRDHVPPFGKLFIRNLFLFIWPVECIVLVVDDKKRRLGDKVANTLVVTNPNKASMGVRIIPVVSILVLYAAFLVFFIGSAMKSSDAYKVAIAEIEKNEAILEETGGITGYGYMPIGNVSISNGSGNAELEIRVIGKNRDVEVSVVLSKERGADWTVVELNANSN